MIVSFLGHHVSNQPVVSYSVLHNDTLASSNLKMTVASENSALTISPKAYAQLQRHSRKRHARSRGRQVIENQRSRLGPARRKLGWRSAIRLIRLVNIGWAIPDWIPWNVRRTPASHRRVDRSPSWRHRTNDMTLVPSYEKAIGVLRHAIATNGGSVTARSSNSLCRVIRLFSPLSHRRASVQSRTGLCKALCG